MSKIVICDYGCGNIQSLINAFKYIGYAPTLLSKTNKLKQNDKLIIPGVGNFEYAMKLLINQNIDKKIKKFAKSGGEILGICLGFQILFETSEESLQQKSSYKGLSLLKGGFKRFPKIYRPLIGWNKIQYVNNQIKGEYFYFVHSYYLPITKKTEKYCFLKADYPFEYCAGIKKDNITGVQFHPERSGEKGLKFLKDWSKS